VGAVIIVPSRQRRGSSAEDAEGDCHRYDDL
jgi:hypothetical protein